jgi:hypothetical protein
MESPAPNGHDGRDALGRFLQGNLFGKGNPFARHSAALRKAFYDEATPEDLAAIARKLLNAAKGGVWVAAQVALRWLLGKPPDPIDPYALLIRAAALEVVHRAREEMRGESADPEAPGRGKPELPDLELRLGGR